MFIVWKLSKTKPGLWIIIKYKTLNENVLGSCLIKKSQNMCKILFTGDRNVSYIIFSSMWFKPEHSKLVVNFECGMLSVLMWLNTLSLADTVVWKNCRTVGGGALLGEVDYWWWALRF